MTEMRLIDWNRIFKEVKESLQENPHTTKEQRDMHNHEHNHFLCMLMEQPIIDPEDLPIVQELREQLAKVTAERNALLKEFAGECGVCANYEKCRNNPCYCINGNMWEWCGLNRGVQNNEE